jgi:hypothetical protein
MLDQDSPDAVNEKIWCAGRPESVISKNNAVIIRIPFQAREMNNLFLKTNKEIDKKVYEFVVRRYLYEICCRGKIPVLVLKIASEFTALMIKPENR